ncbi:hypothetical protein H671_5g14294 [Cricetulus griseus]|nr:hypothetical protein H671_5g14294 [Cricetulus griseus]
MKSMFLGFGSVLCWYPSYLSGEQEFHDDQISHHTSNPTYLSGPVPSTPATRKHPYILIKSSPLNLELTSSARKFTAISSSSAILGAIGNSGISVELLV